VSLVANAHQQSERRTRKKIKATGRGVLLDANTHQKSKRMTRQIKVDGPGLSLDVNTHQ